MHDELLETFHDFYNKLKNIGEKYSLLKRDHVSLINEFAALKNKYYNYMSISCTSWTKCEDLESFNLELKNKLV